MRSHNNTTLLQAGSHSHPSHSPPALALHAFFFLCLFPLLLPNPFSNK